MDINNFVFNTRILKILTNLHYFRPGAIKILD